MLLIIGLIFLGVFIVTVLLMVAMGTGASKEVKERLASLESTFVRPSSESEQELVDIRKEELLSSLPWLNRLLVKADVAPRLRLILYQADVKWTVGGLLLMSLGVWVGAGFLLWLRIGSTPAAALLGLIFAFAPLGYVLRQRGRRFSRFEQGLPQSLDIVVSALRAGHSLISALGIMARESPEPISGEFRKCFDEQNYGLDLRTALQNLVIRVPIQDMRMIVTAILIQRESGGNLAEVLEKVAHVIRERFRLKRQIRVHTAQGRLTGWILSLLPVVLGVLLYLVDPEHMSVLWKRPVGLKLIYAAACMTIIGSLIIRKIVRIRV